jgi:hypothetical protein
VTFRALDRVVYFLAAGLVWSSCALTPLAVASRKTVAPQGVSVEDVERILANDKGKSDAKVAQQLSGLELTERMSSAKLKSLEQSVRGTKSRRALLALADASVFLSPAAADVLSQLPPDLSEQRRMVALTVEYLAKTVPKLPNFYATRTIVRFEAKQNGGRAWVVSSWRQVGSSKVVVAYRDGKEVINPREWGEHPHHGEGEGLITRGTFGPLLSMVLVDAAQVGLTWSRWERGSAGTLAVFRYRIPQERSHYSVGIYAPSSDKGDAAQKTAYHGEVAIDPSSGTILRLAVQAEQPLSSPILQSDIMVEYGPVEIGGKTYTCPVRSVSIGIGSGFMSVYPFTPSPSPADTTLLNDMTFENYRVFRSESRILTGGIPASDH